MVTTGKIGKLQAAAVLFAAAVSATLCASDAATSGSRSALLSPVQERMRKIVSVEFKDTNIDDVLSILARQADVDILKSPKVQGKVTAVLRNIPLNEALMNILDVHGFGYIATDNMIRVVPKDEIYEVREKLVSHVYRITYANVVEVERALRGFLSEQGSISANPGTGNIIVTDIESKVRAINAFIEEIDRITPQIMVDARIYDITSTDSLDVGIQWHAGTASFLGDTFGDNINTNPYLDNRFSSPINNTDSSSLFRYGILNSSVNIDVALKASQDDVRAKLLANPRILVLNGEQAEIKIVDEIPYQELTETSGGGSIGTTQFRDVGVELRVVPYLTRDGLIRLHLNPKFSTRVGNVELNTGLDLPKQPVVATRETTTVALIHDKETVVIGGLKKQDVTQQKNKVPLLGDLPLLGALFRFEGEKTVNSELVIFITPHLIVNPALTAQERLYLQETDIPSPRSPEPRLGRPTE